MDLLASDRVRVSVKAGTESVEKTLAAVDGVGEVLHVGPDTNHDGYELWTVRVTGEGGAEEPIVTAVVQAAGRAGWSIASIGTDTRNLEQVFRDLMSAHVAREGSAGDGAS